MVLSEARSPKDLLFVGQDIRGLFINLTLMPVRDALTSSVPTAFWPSLPIRGSNDKEMKEEPPHRPRHQASTNQRVCRADTLALGAKAVYEKLRAQSG